MKFNNAQPIFNPDMMDPERADIMDMYFCAAPPPPADFEPVVLFRAPKPPEPLKNPGPMTRTLLRQFENGAEILPEEYANMVPEEATALKLFISKVQHFKNCLHQHNSRVTMIREVQWRWMFARMAMSSRADARKEKPANG